MGGKSSAPAAPDYTPVAASSLESAKLQAKTASEQLQWSKDQYADEAPATKAYLAQQTASSAKQTADAQTDRNRYESIYQPVENKFVDTANNWNSADRAQQQSGAAMADVSSAFDAARTNATSQLESFGIDPSQTRFGAMDLGTRVSQAAATAAAGTQSRLNTQSTGLALQGEAINIGKGYPGQVAQSYAGATNSGSSGITSALNTSSTYGNLMGTGTQWGALSNQSNAGATGALNTGYNNALGGAALNQKSRSDTMSGIGSLASIAVVGGIAI